MNNIKPIAPSSKLDISYGFAPTKFKFDCFVAFEGRGIYFLAFTDENNKSNILEELKRCWKNANFKEDIPRAKSLINQMFSNELKDYDFLVHGSEFQIKVWKALMNVAHGTTISYEEIAEKVGGKNYTRAAASAIAKNDISYLIPCHRIINKTGNTHKYRWGSSVKEQLISWEAAK